MDAENKNRIVLGIKMIVLTIYVGLTIATCAGVWNYCTESLIKWGALALAICNGVLAVKYYLRLKKDYSVIMKR